MTWRTLALAVAAAALAGCAVVSPTAPAPGAGGQVPAPPAARPASGGCAAAVVQLLEPAPLFTGPQAQAALDRALPAGQRLQLCGAQGQRQQVLLPRAGQRCSGPTACASGWIPRAARTGPAP